MILRLPEKNQGYYENASEYISRFFKQYSVTERIDVNNCPNLTNLEGSVSKEGLGLEGSNYLFLYFSLNVGVPYMTTNPHNGVLGYYDKNPIYFKGGYDINVPDDKINNQIKINITNSDVINISEIKCIGATIVGTSVGYGSDRRNKYSLGNIYLRYKLQYKPNNTTSYRKSVIHIDYNPNTREHHSYDIILNQDRQTPKPVIEITETYKYQIISDLLNNPTNLVNGKIIVNKPTDATIQINYHQQFRYIYLYSYGSPVVPVSYTTIKSKQFTITNIYTYEQNKVIEDGRTVNTYVQGFRIDAQENTTSKLIKDTFSFYGKNQLHLLKVSIVQNRYGEENVEEEVLDIPDNIDLIFKDTFEEDILKPNRLVCIDTNTGQIIDSTRLIYKNKNVNIYKTIQQKDNTLFLGNYRSGTEINYLYNIIQEHYRDILYKDNCWKELSFSSQAIQTYSEKPNMLLSSQDKHLFKRGEKYLLGLVFINKQGERTSVQFVGDLVSGDTTWIPTLEPMTTPNNTYKKPVYVVALKQALCTILNNKNIIGVIPVYAKHTSYNILCQGYLNATMSNQDRLTQESVGSQYSWFYRGRFPLSESSNMLYIRYGEWGANGSGQLEIQSLDSNKFTSPWKINRKIVTVNSPEIEVYEGITESLLKGVKGRLISNAYSITPYTNVNLKVSGSYQHSNWSPNNIFRSDTQVISLPSIGLYNGYVIGWYGFINQGWKSNEIYSKTGSLDNYGYYPVYPWNRNIPGGEDANYKILTKKWYNHIYMDYTNAYCPTTNSDGNALIFPNIYESGIFREDGSLQLLNLKDEGVYQGSVDYIINCTSSNKSYPIKACVDLRWTWKRAFANKEEGSFSGYNSDGESSDFINMKYKSANHIVLNLYNDFKMFTPKDGNGNENRDVAFGDLTTVELYNDSVDMPYTEQDLKSYQWIQCGPMRQIKEDETTYITFEEGDYFYGRFDSLRTQPYTESDVNQVVEVVSGKLCSRINLDARTDRNRGNLTGNINNRNFNLFNPVYNQLNNYFTYYYEDVNDLIYDRSFKNSIQWSMTKTYGNEVDDWCNIQDVNTLDLDGDKGQVNALYKLGNNLLAFQDSGIAQIQYNEKTQLATDQGVPVEIANSGKVDGKYYLYNNIGCQNQQAITTSPTGIFFIDGINRNIYTITNQGELKDLTTTLGMNAWALKNLNTKWWSYYDSISQEVLFSNEIETLVYSDPYQNFRAFLGYGGIKHYFRAQDSTIQILPQNFNQVISLDQKEGVDIIKDSKKVDYKSVTLWKKNSQEESSFFGNNVPFEIEILCNPEHNQDKIFNNIEYRADSFSLDGTYIPNDTFTNLKVDTEYQTSGNISLDWSIDSPSNLSKKFRIWRIQIPRNQGTRDRIRNPWCKIKLSHNNNTNTNSSNKGIWQDVTSILSKEDIANLSKYTTLPQYAKDQYTVALYDGDIEDEDKFIGAYKYSSPSRFVFYDMNISYMI